MTPARDDLVNPTKRLPDLSLPALGGNATYRVRRQGRVSTVLVLIHGPQCDDCLAYLESIGSEREALQDWDGRVLAITSAGAASAEGSHAVPILLDPESSVAGALGAAPAAVAIADQWGQVHVLEAARDGHELLPPEEIISWLKYLAIQCPECQAEAL